MAKTKSSEQANKEKERQAVERARERARTARWDLNIAIFLFAILIIVIILLFQGINIAVVSAIAVFGLAMVWLVGWRQGRQLYERFVEEELAKFEYERARKVEEVVKEAIQRTLLERRRR